MKTIIINLCLAVILFAVNPAVHASVVEPTVAMKAEMTREIGRGAAELLSCASGKNSDGEITACLNSVLDGNIRKETDTLPFLVGTYFAAWAKLINSEPSAGVKEKWLEVSFNRFSEMQGESGLSDKEICDAAGISYSLSVQAALKRMRN